jgi:60 kDa SS-A/Ro ribonucleoprotein
MTDALSKIRTRNTVTPQKEQADPRQVKNSPGGYVFEVAGEDRIKRFLCLGTQGGSYHIKETALTKENAAVVIDWAKNRSSELVEIVHEISVEGRAPRQNPSLFALAAVFAFGDDNGKSHATAAFNDIVRTGYDLFLFAGYADQFRGWGRALRRAVADWYTSKNVNDLSYQLVKYRQREGWTHNRLLDLAHPTATDTEQNALFAWVVGKNNTFKGDGNAVRPAWVLPYEAAKGFGQLPKGGSKSVYADIIREHPGMPWEALPDVALTYPETWEALLDAGMPIGALLRNLPKLTNHGLLTGSRLAQVTTQLTTKDILRRGRVHPVKILYALKTYASGHSIKGSSTWTPVQGVVDALDAAFYTSFGTIEPAGKRTLLALDCSDSMTWERNMCGVLQAREAAAAMAMVTLASEPGAEVVGFSAGPGATMYNTRAYYSTGIERLPLSPRRRLDDNVRTVASARAGGTDCALPMIWARENKLEIDTFVVYTDNETHSGTIHPHEALRQYRQATGINAKLIVAGMASNGFTIAHPDDPGMLDVCGFDSDSPSVISGFSRGDFS